MADNNSSSLVNPLQTNNSAIVLVGYLSGIAAAKLPIFDLATWNYIFMSIGGILFTVVPLILNRKTAVVSTVANLPEVAKVEVANTPAGKALAQSDATPNNVVTK